MNKINLIGRLTKDPELKYTPGNGTAVTSFILAVNRKYKKEGQPEADFIPIVIWGKQAEATATYMSKGSQIAISGRIETRNYDNKDGVKVYVTEVIAEDVEFLGSKSEGSKEPQKDTEPAYGKYVTPIENEDIPF